MPTCSIHLHVLVYLPVHRVVVPPKFPLHKPPFFFQLLPILTLFFKAFFCEENIVPLFFCHSVGVLPFPFTCFRPPCFLVPPRCLCHYMPPWFGFVLHPIFVFWYMDVFFFPIPLGPFLPRLFPLSLGFRSHLSFLRVWLSCCFV